MWKKNINIKWILRNPLRYEYELMQMLVVKKIKIFFYPKLLRRVSKKSLSDEPDLELFINI